MIHPKRIVAARTASQVSSRSHTPTNTSRTPAAVRKIAHAIEKCEDAMPDPAIEHALHELQALKAAAEQQWPLPTTVIDKLDLGPFAAKNIDDWNPELAKLLMKLDYELRDNIAAISPATLEVW